MRIPAKHLLYNAMMMLGMISALAHHRGARSMARRGAKSRYQTRP